MTGISRRALIKAAAAQLCGAFALGTRKAVAAEPSLRPGLSLYSVAASLHADLDGTLAAISAIGIRDVEISLISRPPAALLNASLRTHSLNAFSVHAMPGTAVGSEIEFAKQVGAGTLVLASPNPRDPSILRDRSKTPKEIGVAYLASLAAFSEDDWAWHAAQLNAWGAAAKEAGLQFAYHTHGVEFRRLRDGTAMDLILGQTDPSLVNIELDCGWAANAGVDVAAWISAHRSRIRLLHIKDVAPGSQPRTDFNIETAPLGSGRNKWKDVIAAARQARIAHYLLEPEPNGRAQNGLDEVTPDFAYLSRLLS